MMTIKELREISKRSTNGKAEYIKSFQDVNDITRQLRRAEFASRPFARKAKKFFVHSDKLKTCQRLWTFLRVYIKYEAEPATRQTAKTIPRFFIDQKGDCKHYAVTSVGLLQACGIPSWFVIVRQSSDRRKWHVYAAALVNHQVVIVDPCRKNFNDECRYIKRYQVAPK